MALTLSPTSDSAKLKIDDFAKITNWVKLKNKYNHNKVLLNNFPMNGHTGTVHGIESYKTLYHLRFLWETKR